MPTAAPASPHLDAELCARAVRSRDARFDGWFFVAVTSTGIYCRPSCPARPPRAENMRFHPTAASAQRAGFRACKRCRPDASPGSPEWNHRADVVARAMRLIVDGVVDREGVPGLAGQLGYSARQVERHLSAELGAGPLALARAQRAQTARLLLETTDLSMGDVATAAGFNSIRAFNDTLREVFAAAPTDLRRRRNPAVTASSVVPEPVPVPVPRAVPVLREAGVVPGPAGAARAVTLNVRLPFRAPLCPDNLFGHLAATAVPGIEEWRDGAYRRTMRTPHGHAIVALRPLPDHIGCRLALTDVRDLAPVIGRCRRLLDLDADPVAVDGQLAADPALAPLVARAPGRRVPRTVDPVELAVRAVLGQQISVAAARTHAARLVTAVGTPIQDPEGGLTHLWPRITDLAEHLEHAEDLDLAEHVERADADPSGHRAGGAPRGLALPAARRRTVAALVTGLASGTIELGAGGDRERGRAALAALPGIGPWTLETIAMRALGDPDAFLPGDLGVRRGAERLGLPATPAALSRRAAGWRPWRAYAVQHLWAVLDHPVNRMPAPDPPTTHPDPSHPDPDHPGPDAARREERP
ncbi:DNA-3-methyladenine glycosylase 2 family protein [Parafrankia discariae]|uniref:DNA-3-methyladenine glycosylase 2 family protein n=1 Tax=Parafrankia discariae TaxID=365528 RepID=UPI00035EDCCF|nr:AlkA N-terminal domain-containing protein [Parafrankia discariae]